MFELDTPLSLSPTTEGAHWIIEGAAAGVLAAYPERFNGRFKLLYADPPYNTGFHWRSYQDRAPVAEYKAGLRTVFASAKRLLQPDASVWVSIDDRAVHHVRDVLDDVFGPAAFVATCVWQKRASRENRGGLGDAHEYLVVYAPNPDAFRKTCRKVPTPAGYVDTFKNPNDDPKGPWRTVPLSAQSLKGRPNQYYDIVAPSGRVHRPPSGRCWGLVEETYLRLKAEGRIYFGRQGDGVPYRIRYLSEVEGVTPWTWWPHEEVGHTAEAKQEQYAYFGRGGGIDTPKPERLLHRVLSITTDPGDWVLDPFGGSGTTAAVAHKMGRRWAVIEREQTALGLIRERMRQVFARTEHGIPYLEGVSRVDAFKYLRYLRWP